MCCILGADRLFSCAMKTSILDKSLILGSRLQVSKQTFTTAESCTGGGIGYALTSVPGSSVWYEYGFITYSNMAKETSLGLARALLDRFGAVSEPVVLAMLEGALDRASADMGVAVSGIAGPSGGSAEKPVGTVCFAVGSKAQPQAYTVAFSGDRAEVREAAIEKGLELALAWIERNQ